ncbi:unnamed protein product [Rhodiola kirilowii]
MGSSEKKNEASKGFFAVMSSGEHQPCRPKCECEC